MAVSYIIFFISIHSQLNIRNKTFRNIFSKCKDSKFSEVEYIHTNVVLFCTKSKASYLLPFLLIQLIPCFSYLHTGHTSFTFSEANIHTNTPTLCFFFLLWIHYNTSNNHAYGPERKGPRCPLQRTIILKMRIFFYFLYLSVLIDQLRKKYFPAMSYRKDKSFIILWRKYIIFSCYLDRLILLNAFLFNAIKFKIKK